MTEPGQRVYTILDIDMESAIAAGQRQPVNQTMLATLAARFSLAASGTGSASGWAPPWLPIWLASSTADRFKNSTLEWFTENVAAGNEVQIPYAGDAWEWRNVTVKATSLEELCAQDRQRPDPLRIGGPALTSSLLYFHILNEAYRRLYSGRLSPGSRQNLDLDPGSLRFEKNDELFLPYPIRRKGVVVKATTSDGTTVSATTALAPPWVIQFYDMLNEVDKKAAELAVVNKICLSCEQDGCSAWSQIMVLHELVRLQVSTAAHPSASLGRLEQLLRELDAQARDILFVNIAAAVVPEANSKRTKLADELADLLSMERPAISATQLSRQDLEARFRQFPFERVKESERLIEMKDRVLTRAYVALAASPRAALAHEAADKVIKELEQAAAANDRVSEPGSAAVGAATSIVSTSVGNLPGPSTLAVAFVWLRTSRKVTEAASAAGDPTKSVVLAERLAAEVSTVLGPSEAQAIVAAAASTDRSVAEAGAALGAKLGGKTAAVSDAVAGNFMVGKGWSVVMFFVNVIALGNTLVTTDKNNLRKGLNVAGGVVWTGFGMLQMLKSLAPKGPFKAMLEGAGRPFGVVAVVASLFSGVITAVSSDTLHEKVGGGLQAASGGLSLVGFAIGSGPIGLGFVIVGGVVMLASVAASNWDAITDELAQVKRRSELGPRVVLAEQLKRFLAFPVVQRVGLSLRSAVNEALNQLESPDDSGLHLFEPNDPSLAVLRTLRFAEDDIDFMTRLVTNQVFGGGF